MDPLNKQDKIPMPKETAMHMIAHVINYLAKEHPKIDIQDILTQVHFKTPYYVENLQTGKIELVTVKHIKNTNYWVSHHFTNMFGEQLLKQGLSPDIFYHAGRSLYKSQPFLKTGIGIPVLGIQKTMVLFGKEANKHSRIIASEIVENKKGFSKFRIVYKEGYVAPAWRVRWGDGLVDSNVKLAGATEVKTTSECVQKGPEEPGGDGQAIFEFKLIYKEVGLLKRVFSAWVFTLPIVKKEIDQAYKIQAENREQILNREEIIEEKTAELTKANKELSKLDTLKTEFYTNITHELRTPLTLIKSQVEAVENCHFGRTIKHTSDVFASIKRNAIVLNRLIDNLLDFSKIESGKTSALFEKTKVAEFLSFIISNFESAAEYKNITHEFINKTQNLFAYFDQGLIEKVVNNLLSNAIKFTSSGGHIALCLDENKDDVLISVEDTGIGISEKNQKIIFERFRQVDATSTRQYEGTGIGLSLVKEIVKLHKGEITVDSEPDIGSKFTIRIPKNLKTLKQEATTQEKGTAFARKSKFHAPDKKKYPVAKEDDPRAIPPKSDFTILIVEDNKDLCSFLKSIISPVHNVYVSKNGIEAISLLDQHQVDLVITDIMMPVMDGLELLKHIRLHKRLSWLPVIMLTARADFKMKMDGFSHGANDYVIKPFNPDELLARIHSQLSLVRLRREYTSALKDKKDKTLTDNTIVAIEKVKSYIESNYTDSMISRENLSSIVDMSPGHLSRMFKKHTGKKIHDLIKELRIQAVAKELKNSDELIINIAFDAGFETLSSFNRVFKKINGMTPTEYRKKQERSEEI